MRPMMELTGAGRGDDRASVGPPDGRVLDRPRLGGGPQRQPQGWGKLSHVSGPDLVLRLTTTSLEPSSVTVDSCPRFEPAGRGPLIR